METKEQAPWVDYLVDNGEDDDMDRKLLPDTPKEIKEKYEAYKKMVAEATKRGEWIAK